MNTDSAVFIVILKISVQNLLHSVLQKWNTEAHNIIFTYESKTFDNTSLSDGDCQHVNFMCACISQL